MGHSRGVPPTLAILAGLGVLSLACGGTDRGGLAAADGSPPGTHDATSASDSGDPERDGPPSAPQLLHVDPRIGANALGDGSRERPYPDAAHAFAVARPGDVVFLLPGEHPPLPPPPSGVEVLGAGTEVTRVAGPLSLDEGARVRALTVVGGTPGVHFRGDASLESVTITGAVGVGIQIDAAAQLDEVRVTAVVPDPEQGADARDEGGLWRCTGVQVNGGGTLRWRGGGVTGVAGVGLRATDAALEIDEVALADLAGIGILAAGGQTTLRAVSVRGAVAAGVRVVEGTSRIADLQVHRVADDPVQNTAGGLEILAGEAEVSALHVEDAVLLGLRLSQSARVNARGVFVRKVQTGVGLVNESVLTADGLEVEAVAYGLAVNRSEAEVVGLSVRGATGVGVLVSRGSLVARTVNVQGGGRGVSWLEARGTLTDFTVAGTETVGVQITDGEGPIELREGRIEGCGDAGVGIFGARDVTIEEVTVAATRRGAEGEQSGVQMLRGRLTSRGLVIEDTDGPGLLAEGATVQLSGGRLSRNRGPGVALLEPQPSRLTEVRVEDNRGGGLLIAEGGARLESVEVTGTLPGEDGPGHGLVGLPGGVLDIIGGGARGNAGDGLHLMPTAGASLSGVSLVDNGGYGVFARCGAVVEEPPPSTLSGNTRGARSCAD